MACESDCVVLDDDALVALEIPLSTTPELSTDDYP
jgi:hypothetical protein